MHKVEWIILSLCLSDKSIAPDLRNTLVTEATVCSFPGASGANKDVPDVGGSLESGGTLPLGEDDPYGGSTDEEMGTDVVG